MDLQLDKSLLLIEWQRTSLAALNTPYDFSVDAELTYDANPGEVPQ